MGNQYTSFAMTVLLLANAGLLAGFAAHPKEQGPKQSEGQTETPARDREGTPERKTEMSSKPKHAYHGEPPTGALPATLDPSRFTDNRAAFVAYSLAAKIPEILYQEPCYCPCDVSEDHRSLLDCFTGKHGMTCHVCQAEVFFAYEGSKSGKTVTQIRNDMNASGFGKMDVDKYVEAYYSDLIIRHQSSINRRKCLLHDVNSIHRTAQPTD